MDDMLTEDVLETIVVSKLDELQIGYCVAFQMHLSKNNKVIVEVRNYGRGGQNVYYPRDRALWEKMKRLIKYHLPDDTFEEIDFVISAMQLHESLSLGIDRANAELKAEKNREHFTSYDG